MSNKPTREIKKGHVKWRFIAGHLLSSDCYFDSVIFLAMCVWAWGISHKARLELVEHELFIISWTIVICNRRLIWGRITAYLRSSKFSMSAKSELTHHNMPTVWRSSTGLTMGTTNPLFLFLWLTLGATQFLSTTQWFLKMRNSAIANVSTSSSTIYTSKDKFRFGKHLEFTTPQIIFDSTPY